MELISRYGSKPHQCIRSLACCRGRDEKSMGSNMHAIFLSFLFNLFNHIFGCFFLTIPLLSELILWFPLEPSPVLPPKSLTGWIVLLACADIAGIVKNKLIKSILASLVCYIALKPVCISVSTSIPETRNIHFKCACNHIDFHCWRYFELIVSLAHNFLSAGSCEAADCEALLFRRHLSNVVRYHLYL